MDFQKRKFSKTIDYNDWYVTPVLFKMLTVRRWGVATLDRFASEKNRKTMRFDSKHLSPGTLGVDAFACDWAREFNWLVPPVYLIGKTLLIKSRLQSDSSLPILDISYILAINRNKI